MPKTTDIEKHYFNQFAKCYPLPSGDVIYQDKPDVRINFNNNAIGIEITTFYIKDGDLLDSEQKQSSIRHKVIKKAHDLYLKSGGKNIELSFSFNNIVNSKILANNIAVFVKSIENYVTGEIPKSAYKHIPELSFVYLNSKEYDDAKWQNTQMHSITPMSEVRLRGIICSKEIKAQEYDKLDEMWLLIVIDFMNFAQDQQIIEVSGIESKIFNKIIIFKTVFNQIYEIQ